MNVFVTGTDTGIGKTVFAAGLTQLLGAAYWKPIQSGLLEETDTEIVTRLAGLPPDRVIPERYRLNTPASPHLAARLDLTEIDAESLEPPGTDRPLVIEGAGGVLVPLTRSVLYVDVMARWSIPTVLCARTALGTINHTLLSLEALRARKVPVIGIAFIGDEHLENENIIAELGRVRILGRLPRLPNLTPTTLREAFGASFVATDFRGHAP